MSLVRAESLCSAQVQEPVLQEREQELLWSLAVARARAQAQSLGQAALCRAQAFLVAPWPADRSSPAVADNRNEHRSPRAAHTRSSRTMGRTRTNSRASHRHRGAVHTHRRSSPPAARRGRRESGSSIAFASASLLEIVN
jgi:hypothetical protein